MEKYPFRTQNSGTDIFCNVTFANGTIVASLGASEDAGNATADVDYTDVSLFGITTPATYVVEMYEDSTESSSFEIGSDVTVNGNGHKIVLAEGVTLTNNGTLNDVTVVGPVAKIGETEYATLAEAIAAAQNGDTIVFVADVTLAETITIQAGQNIVLDLNGKAVTYDSTTQGEAMITNKGTLTINGGLIEGYSAIWVQNPGKNTVNGTLTITGGEIRTTAAAYVNGTAALKDVSSGIYCTIDGDGGAWSDASFITITGGTFNENVKLATEAPKVTIGGSATFNGNKLISVWVSDNVTGAKEVIEEIKTNTMLNDYTPENLPAGAVLEIELKSVGETIVFDVTPKANGTEVTPTQAITFRLPVPASVNEAYAKIYHDETLMGIYEIKGEGNAKYVEISSADFSEYAVEPTNVTPVAKIDGVGYATLADAIAAAQDGDTITLIADITVSDIIVINKAITLDGNNKTLTSTAGRAINVSGTNGVTIKNLTINASGERAINIIQNATNVTIENVTATAANYTVNVAASTPNAVVAIKNSTLNGLCTVNVSGAGAEVTITDSTINCNDNNATAGESYAALSLNKDAKGGKITATGCTINVAESSDSVKARNGAEDGVITIDGKTDDVNVVVAFITYAGSDNYHAFCC